MLRKDIRRVVTLALCTVVGSGVAFLYATEPAVTPSAPPVYNVGMFESWPKEGKPDFVLLLTGQTYGYLAKCGCSDPQKGGLERRYNIVQMLTKKGWPIIPLDLGDHAPHTTEAPGNLPTPLRPQTILKYETAMKAMKIIGYKAVGVSKEEFAMPLIEGIAAYSLQEGNEEPRLLSANLVGESGIPKAMAFPNAKGAGAITDYLMIPAGNQVVGVTSYVGDTVVADVKKFNGQIQFDPKGQAILAGAVVAMQKANVRVLLYQGPLEMAMKAAVAAPGFDVIVCQSPESEPPGQPTMVKVGERQIPIVQVGHKGQNLALVGFYGKQMHFQRIAVTPEFETPAEDEANHPVLKELEKYAAAVKSKNFLTSYRKEKHPLQIQNKVVGQTYSYVGSDKCAGCHDTANHDPHGNAQLIWSVSKHAKAYDNLERYGKKPSLRNFDGECIVCHTVGFRYETGFVDAVKTPFLKGVGCESCHGPGSVHVANPTNHALAVELSPWKIDGEGRLPDLNKKDLNEAERKIMLRVDSMCQKCHDPENDPHFKIEVYWPKIAHGKQAAVRGPMKDGPQLVPTSGPK